MCPMSVITIGLDKYLKDMQEGASLGTGDSICHNGIGGLFGGKQPLLGNERQSKSPLESFGVSTWGAGFLLTWLHWHIGNLKFLFTA